MKKNMYLSNLPTHLEKYELGDSKHFFKDGLNDEKDCQFY